MQNNQIEQINSLKKEGWSYCQIAEKLNLPETSVRYHYDPNYKKSAIKRSRAYRVKEPLQPKINQFFTENPEDRDFTLDDVKKKFFEQKCYLTGSHINFDNIAGYAFDHIVPKYQGGKSNLANMGLLRRDINQAKADKTPEQFISICIEVLEHNGYKVTR
jgi:5-methylcytosine-specific restriction endonuclease McrA